MTSVSIPHFGRQTAATAIACILALVASVMASPDASAKNGTGNYANWSMSGTSGTLPALPNDLLAATITSTSNVSTPSGASAWLPAWTPFGQEYGSSQGKKYLSVPVGATSSTLSMTFANPTPVGSWGFTLGDVDAETVKITALDADGQPVNVSSWFKDSFNYCWQTPRPSTCPGTVTVVPTWNAPTLDGNGTDTTGASGWFQPDVSLTSITFEGTSLAGFPTYQVWLAADKPIPTPTPTPPPAPKPTPKLPVTLTPQVVVTTTPPGSTKPVKVLKPIRTCTSKTKRIVLSGTTRKRSQWVTIYRAKKIGKSATKIKRVKSKKGKFRVTKVSTRNCNQPVFCARTSRAVSKPIRLKVKRKKATRRTHVSIAPRGEVKSKKVVCPARGTR